MRDTSSEFDTEAAKSQTYPIELLDIFLGSQTADDEATLHFAINDQPVDFFNLDSGAQTYTPIGIRRSSVSNILENEQRQVTLEIDNIDRAFQAFFFQNADYMRDKRVILRHVFNDELSAYADGTVIIDAVIHVVRITEKVCQIDLGGIVGGLRFKTGRSLDRLCPLICGGALCASGISLQDLTQETADTVVAGSTTTAVKLTTAAQADDYWAIGTLEFTSGQNNGYLRKVIGWVQSTKTATLDFALPFAPGAGDTVKIKRDCDKTLDECRDRFTEVDAVNGNTDNFHGFPSVVQTINP